MKYIIDLTNPFIIIFFVGTFVSFIIKHFLEFVDYKARKRNNGNIPEILKDIPLANETFDSEKLKKICEYENAKYFTWIPLSFCVLILDLCLVLFCFYPYVCSFSNMICESISSQFGRQFLSCFIYSILISLPKDIISIPFDLYTQFKLEKKFGFSNITIKIWISDQIKNIILTLILNALIVVAAVFFMNKCPDLWWLILSSVLIGFTFIMQIIYPKFIAPLFNKFNPLPEGELKEKISGILEKTGFKNDGLFVMDASKRSGHSNAYFSGFGKSKQIVLYDTLINSLTPDELTSVLAHELGHFKLKHILKRLLVLIPMEFVLFFVLFKLTQLPLLYNGFGFSWINLNNIQFAQFYGLFLTLTIYESISEILSPIVNYSSRKNEYQADNFAKKICGTPEYLITGLIKLNSDNLHELFPPSIYVFWNYSHPTLVERIKALKED